MCHQTGPRSPPREVGAGRKSLVSQIARCGLSGLKNSRWPPLRWSNMGEYLQWLVVEQNKTQPAGRVSHPCHIPFRIRPIGGVSAGTPGGRNPVAARITSSGEWAESGPTGLGDRRSRVQVSAARPWAAARVSTRWPLWLRYRLATRQHGLWVCRPRGGRWRRPCGVALMLHYLLHVLLVIALNRSQGAVT